MKARTLLALLALLAFSASAYAAVDYTCVNQCTAQGMLYQYCVSRCSFDTQPPTVPQYQPYQPQQQPRTDYQCLNNCTAKGYQYGFCRQQCSY